jgi:major membrane immunogen (membrane-anchored lipoprotein)
MIEPVKNDFMWDLFRLEAAFNQLAKNHFEIASRDANDQLKELDSISCQKKELLRQKADELASQHKWNIIQNVAQYISSTSAIVLGLSVISAAHAAGWFLLAAGGLGLFNRISSDTGAWRWAASHFTSSHESAAKLSRQIERGAEFTALAIAVIGMINAYHLGALAWQGRDLFMSKLLQAVTFASVAISAAARLGIALSDKKAASAKADLKEKEGRAVSIRIDLRQNTDEIVHFNDIAAAIDAAIKQAILSRPV